jgi:hypothetical protein
MFPSHSGYRAQSCNWKHRNHPKTLDDCQSIHCPLSPAPERDLLREAWSYSDKSAFVCTLLWKQSLVLKGKSLSFHLCKLEGKTTPSMGGTPIGLRIHGLFSLERISLTHVSSFSRECISQLSWPDDATTIGSREFLITIWASGLFIFQFQRFITQLP